MSRPQQQGRCRDCGKERTITGYGTYPRCSGCGGIIDPVGPWKVKKKKGRGKPVPIDKVRGKS